MYYEQNSFTMFMIIHMINTRTSSNLIKLTSIAALSIAISACDFGNKKPNPIPVQKAREPVIALALGGGGAKGFAHIGVIKVLESHGIKAKIVTGTSAGSFVGSIYASGKTPYQLQEIALKLEESDIRDLTLSRQGFVVGQKLQDYVNQQVGNKSIQQFPKRFAAVATELNTGKKTDFIKGNAGQAVRASCSIPGLMAPVAHNGYWLVDGAVVNPIPISLTRALGADIVIAVDLQHDAHLMQQDLLSFNVSEENSENGDSLPWHARLKERLGSITTRRAVTAPTATEIMTTSIQVLENRLKRNRMAGDPPDILIQPVCPQISTLDFHRAHAAIAAGQLAVERKMDELLPLVRTNI